MISAQVIADSLSPAGTRLTTFVCTYHRFILAEVNTHKILSRNTASSRAIPIQKMINAVLNKPAMPVNWGKNQKGMQAKSLLNQLEAELAENEWESAKMDMIAHAEELIRIGVHKQIANRLLEPFSYTTTILSGTEWGNFFNLRASKEAQPEFAELAFQMLEAMQSSQPKELKVGEWHLPFADKYLSEGLSTEQLLKITTARCARVSYLNFEGEIDHQKDYDLHDSLISSGHISPAEHPAQALDTMEWSGNFRGFRQYRKTIPNENKTVFDPVKLLAERSSVLAKPS